MWQQGFTASGCRVVSVNQSHANHSLPIALCAMLSANRNTQVTAWSTSQQTNLLRRSKYKVSGSSAATIGRVLCAQLSCVAYCMGWKRPLKVTSYIYCYCHENKKLVETKSHTHDRIICLWLSGIFSWSILTLHRTSPGIPSANATKTSFRRKRSLWLSYWVGAKSLWFTDWEKGKRTANNATIPPVFSQLVALTHLETNPLCQDISSPHLSLM